MKSKQKQLLKNQNLAGAHAARSLRETLREKHRTKASAVSVCVVPVKTAIRDAKLVDAIELFSETEVASRKQCLHLLTVDNIKCILRACSQYLLHLRPFFKCLHSTKRAKFPQDVVGHRSGALTALEARLLKDTVIIACYEKALLTLQAQDPGRGILTAMVQNFREKQAKAIVEKSESCRCTCGAVFEGNTQREAPNESIGCQCLRRACEDCNKGCKAGRCHQAFF